MDSNQKTVFDMVGGEPTFQKLVDIFYARVEADEELRPLFPDDLEPGKRWQYLFLMQFWGGPAQYAQERGHPRLRMRHAPFPIDASARDAWVGHMLAAIDEVGIQEPARSQMRDYFERGATFMINQSDVDVSGGDA
ncbi:MAG: globin [Anaerolineaceae bacterium]|nr:globin [Anaerolineae bacterium]MCB9459938.1 globin [Anaerolineaceae bacterium]